MSYTYQNLMGWKKLKTWQITLQYIQNSDLNESSRNYCIIYKSGHNQIELAGWPNWEFTFISIHMRLGLNAAKFILILRHWCVILIMLLWLIIWLSDTIHGQIDLIRYAAEFFAEVYEIMSAYVMRKLWYEQSYNYEYFAFKNV